ncbi:hypothetical protein Btru_025295 [Bulinus truncatus]|nr:hypothetical protein Btru_025295 [Bulinus truncatus]
MFITVCNTVFFLLTVVHIYRIRKLLDIGRVTKDDQTLFFVYVRLSSLTGIFWILAILSEAIDNQILRSVYIVLNGLLGAFPFVSFVCNKRVWRLLWRGNAEVASNNLNMAE